MLISKRWLSDYVDLSDQTSEAIGEALTSIGLEVESIHSVSPLQGPVVIGAVGPVEKHPDADTLNICTVDVGGKEPLRIVCGASNVRPGLKVVVACIGSTLPGDFKIKASKIRGVASQGMICSEQELGLSDDGDGIMECDLEAPVGVQAASFLGLEDEVFTLGVTPNRADCFSYIGVARDLCAKLGRPLKIPEVDFEASSSKTEDRIKLTIDSEQDCGRFSALFVEGAPKGPSPLWMQSRLTASGMRPINLVVDVSNYVMLETGQPNHCYDEAILRGGEIRVRRARDGETLTTLDGETRTLACEDILICDGEGPIGLAGVMGGQNTEVSEKTKNLIIEAAHFPPGAVRRSAKRLGLHTEASHRFERGVDITGTVIAAQRLAMLLQQCAREVGASGEVKVSGQLLDYFPKPPQPSPIAMRLSRAKKILGLPLLTQDQCIDCLRALGFEFVDKNGDRMLFVKPTWRVDILRETDLIEEVGRMQGLDSISYSLPLMEIGTVPEDPFILFQEQAQNGWATLGFTEVITFPFLAPKDLDVMRISAEHPLGEAIRLKNPISEEEPLLRTTLLPGLVKAMQNNHRHGVLSGRLFEVARSFTKPATGAMAGLFAYTSEQGCAIRGRALQDVRPLEHTMAAGILWSSSGEKNWNTPPSRALDVFDGKAAVESWLGRLGLGEAHFRGLESNEAPFLHPGAAASIEYGQVAAGWVGELHPEVVSRLGLRETPTVFELSLDTVFRHRAPASFKSEFSKFPPGTRDIAILVPLNVHHEDVLRCLQSSGGRRHLSEVRLFDVYTGENITAGKKSLAYSLSFQSTSKTLNDKDIDKELTGLLDDLKRSVSAELR